MGNTITSTDRKIAENRKRTIGLIERIGFKPNELTGKKLKEGIAWAVNAEDPNGFGIAISQESGQPERYSLSITIGLSEENLGELKRSGEEVSKLLWGIRSALLLMGVEFHGLDETLRSFTIYTMIFTGSPAIDMLASKIFLVRRAALYASFLTSEAMDIDDRGETAVGVTDYLM